jgi:hypothetical protein
MNGQEGDKLLEKIKKWLETQGQALEMRVAKIFQENGFSVSQFENIVDQESQSVRQVDVVASLSKEIEGCLLTARLIIECKYAKSRPWVLLLTPQKFDGTFFFSRVLQGNNFTNWKSLPTLQARLIARILLSLKTDVSKFSVEPAGYAIVEPDLKEIDAQSGQQTGEKKTDAQSGQQTGKKKTDTQSGQQTGNKKPKEIAYEAIIQVSKSVEAHDIDNEEKNKNITLAYEQNIGAERSVYSNLNLYLSIAIPVIVINGQLFEAHLGEDNEVKVSKIESGSGFVLMPYKQKEVNIKAQVPLSPIWVVTEEGLKTFIPRVKENLQLLLAQEDAIKDLISFERSKFSKSSLLSDF